MEKQIADRVEECFIIAEKFFGRNLRRCVITFEKCFSNRYGSDIEWIRMDATTPRI